MRVPYHNPDALRGIARDTRHLSPYTATLYLIPAWHYATAPNVYRTIDEHDRCQRYARAIRKRLDRIGRHYRELDSGRLRPTGSVLFGAPLT